MIQPQLFPEVADIRKDREYVLGSKIYQKIMKYWHCRCQRQQILHELCDFFVEKKDYETLATGTQRFLQ